MVTVMSVEIIKRCFIFVFCEEKGENSWKSDLFLIFTFLERLCTDMKPLLYRI